jgi:hypothetical protein
MTFVRPLVRRPDFFWGVSGGKQMLFFGSVLIHT